MGYALAEVAAERGHEVILVSGPVALPPPASVHVLPVETAGEMFAAVERQIADCDCAIFCAAVSDYRVASVAGSKIKKSGDALTLTLEENPDILGSARTRFGFEGLLVGFAAETDNLEENARGKLERKGCDLLVANDVGRSDIGFDREENEVTLFFRSGETRPLARGAKREIAERILDTIDELARIG